MIEETPKLPLEEATIPTNSPAPLPDLYLNDLFSEGHHDLLKRVEAAALPVRAERSRYSIMYELARAHLSNGGKVTAQGLYDNANNQSLLRWMEANFLPGIADIHIPSSIVSQFHLRSGLFIRVSLRLPEGRSRQLTVDHILSIEGIDISQWKAPLEFDKLTALFPKERIYLENLTNSSISARAADLIAPLGKGQRGLIVAAPRVGKTFFLKSIAQGICANHPEVSLILLLVDERPEEVTDFRRELNCEIYSSTFDESPTRHVQVAELVADRARRLVELKKDVVILLDSITRLARSYNNLRTGKGKTMSGGVDSKALAKPKKFFGSARNTEEGGSLTILATALVETQSRMDDLIFEEFKGTGNMEIHLDRSIAEQRIYPAIHIVQSATRRDELLYHPDEMERILLIRRQLTELPAAEAIELLVQNLQVTNNNAEFLLTGLRGL